MTAARFELAAVPWAALVAALGLALAGLGCGKAEGVPFDCECEWLTDFDDAAKDAVHICAKDEREALEVARGCAQIATPAPVQKCVCARARDAVTPCRSGCLERRVSEPQ